MLINDQKHWDSFWISYQIQYSWIEYIQLFWIYKCHNPVAQVPQSSGLSLLQILLTFFHSICVEVPMVLRYAPGHPWTMDHAFPAPLCRWAGCESWWVSAFSEEGVEIPFVLAKPQFLCLSFLLYSYRIFRDKRQSQAFSFHFTWPGLFGQREQPNWGSLHPSICGRGEKPSLKSKCTVFTRRGTLIDDRSSQRKLMWAEEEKYSSKKRKKEVQWGGTWNFTGKPESWQPLKKLKLKLAHGCVLGSN